MRVLLVFLALFPTGVAAEPMIRWLDRTGGLVSGKVSRTIGETGGHISVEIQGKDAVLKLPFARLLEFIREDARVPEQKQLLDGRMSVRAGLDFDRVRPLLDRLAAKASAPWMREYAAAARAMLARKAGEKDALKRIEAFLEAYPQSRFIAEVLIERAWARAHVAKHAMTKIEMFGQAFKEITRRKGSLFVAYGCIPAVGALNARINARQMDPLKRAVLGGVAEERTEPSHAEMTIRLSAEPWFDAAVLGVGWRRAVAAKVDPSGFLNSIGALVVDDDLLLPEIRVEIRLDLAALSVALKKPERARAYLEAARKIPSDAARRLRVEHALRQLDAARDKR